MNDCSMFFYLLGVYYKICSQHLHPVRGSPSRSFQVAPLLQLLIEGRFWTGFTQAKWGFHHQERENPEFQRAATSTTSWGFNSSGWWFGTWLWFFHAVGKFIIPTDELHHFFRGVAQPPTSIYCVFQISTILGMGWDDAHLGMGCSTCLNHRTKMTVISVVCLWSIKWLAWLAWLAWLIFCLYASTMKSLATTTIMIKCLLNHGHQIMVDYYWLKLLMI